MMHALILPISSILNRTIFEREINFSDSSSYFEQEWLTTKFSKGDFFLLQIKEYCNWAKNMKMRV